MSARPLVRKIYNNLAGKCMGLFVEVLAGYSSQLLFQAGGQGFLLYFWGREWGRVGFVLVAESRSCFKKIPLPSLFFYPTWTACSYNAGEGEAKAQEHEMEILSPSWRRLRSRCYLCQVWPFPYLPVVLPSGRVGLYYFFLLIYFLKCPILFWNIVD